MEKTYKKLIFDLDNTLVDDDENRKYAIKQVLLDRDEEATNERVTEFITLDNQFWADRAAGKIRDPYEFKNNEERTTWVRAQRFLKFFQNISFEEATGINSRYINYLSEIVVPIKNSKDILEYLHKRQYDIYIATNGPSKAVNDKLSKIEVQHYIKGFYSADEAGHMKPNRVFFEKMFDKMDISNKADVLIIGDELEKDVLGGIKNGFDSCWLNTKCVDNSTDIKPTYEINDLMELKKYL